MVFDWVKIQTTAHRLSSHAHWTFTDHGPGHILRVRTFTDTLEELVEPKLSKKEKDFLRAAAFLHDIGMSDGREDHHLRSQELISKLTESGKLPFTKEEAEIVGWLCKSHSKEYDPSREDKVPGDGGETQIRSGLLASILRIADGMDVSFARAEGYDEYISMVSPESKPHWDALFTTWGTRTIVSKEGVKIQILAMGTEGDAPAESVMKSVWNISKEIASTPFTWTVEVLPYHVRPVKPFSVAEKKALVFGHCDAHGAIMSAISQRRLKEESGIDAEIVCRKPATEIKNFWKTTAYHPMVDDCDLIITVDIPHFAGRPESAKRAVGEWVKKGKKVIVIDHHEDTIRIMRELAETGAEVWVTDVSTCFYGKAPDGLDFRWAMIGSICDRDTGIVPSRKMSAAFKENELIADGVWMGMLSGSESEVLRRIKENDFEYFKTVSRKCSPLEKEKVHGRVLVVGPIHVPAGETRRVMPLRAEATVKTHFEDGELETPYMVAEIYKEGEKPSLFIGKYWKLPPEKAPPPRELFSLEDDRIFGYRVVGHPGGFWIIDIEENQMTAVRDKMIHCLNNYLQSG